jgi:glycosyltransferase involved in cell wall biosynthesis
MQTLSSQLPFKIRKHWFFDESIESISPARIAEISDNLQKIQSEDPEVSIVIIAYNEGKNLLSCISSLSDIKSSYKIEIIIVDNNSTDGTPDIIKLFPIKYIYQPLKGVGNARQAGMNIAKGKYILNGDADCIYPSSYVDNIMAVLNRKENSAVFGTFAFLPSENKNRTSLAIYELFRDIVIHLRVLKRPELCAGGASFAFKAEFGKQIGWNTEIKRGEDGLMAFSLKKYGKVKLVSNRRTKVWTSSRTLDADGDFYSLIVKRIGREFLRIREYFFSQKKQYAHKSENKIKKD